MIRGLAAAVAMIMITAGCSRPPIDPLRLDGNLLTVYNGTGDEWTGVEISLNTYYRVTWPSIPSDGRFQVRLDSFIAGFGQRFDFRRMQVKALRLTAKRPDGTAVELDKQFESRDLAGALGRK